MKNRVPKHSNFGRQRSIAAEGNDGFKMRRGTRRLIANLAFFLVGLFLLVYLNYHQSTKKTFAWTTIRYKTTSATLPEARGICPGLKGSSKPALGCGASCS
jgi:hypothetical protein